MTKIYKLRTDISTFKEIPLDAEDIAQQLDADERILDFLYMGVKNKRLADDWGKITTAFESSPAYPQTIKIPSISTWAGSCLIFSEKAHAIFRLMLSDYGEFLPIEIQGFTYYIFNNLTDINPDLKKSRYLETGGQKVESLVFTPDATNKLLFKSTWEGCTTCFCNEQFKQQCEEYNIEGLIFVEDLLDEGYLT